MTTLKLHIEELECPELVMQKQMNYSYAFRSLYKQLEMTADKDFMKSFCEKFSLNEHEFRSLKIMVAAQFDAQQSIKKNTKVEIEDLNDILSNEKDPTKRFKIQKKINRKEKSLGNEAVYGGRELLRQITKECNKTDKDIEKLNNLKAGYRKNRISMPFTIIGEANMGTGSLT